MSARRTRTLPTAVLYDSGTGVGTLSLGRRRWACVGASLALVLTCAVTVSADRLLAFTTTTGSIAGVATAEIHADGIVIMRLRSASAAGLGAKAEAVVARLTALALNGLTPDQLAVTKLGDEWALTGAGQLITTGDAATAAANGLTPQALCESWRARLAEVLREPYLTFDPLRSILVPVGERRSVRYGGTLKVTPEVETMSAAIVSVTHEVAGRSIVLQGVSPGTTIVTISFATIEHALRVDVKRWAARLVPQVTARIIGASLGEPMASVAALNSVLNAIQTAPGASVRAVKQSARSDGCVLLVSADGGDLIPVGGNVAVSYVGGLAPVPTARSLLMSNYPERVSGVGALLRQELAHGVPTRLMWHHKNYAGRPLVLAVRLVNTGPTEARLRVGWADAGPNPDEIFVGFNAMARYWDTVMPGAGFEARLPAASSFETVAAPMGPAEVLSGLMDLVNDEGSGVYVEVSARAPADRPDGFVPLRTTGDPLPVTPYEFPATIDDELTYELGERHGYLSIGREGVINDQGIALDGSYGVLHRVRVTMRNPSERAARMEIALRAGGGVARAVLRIDNTTRHTGLMRATEEEILARYDLDPGASRTVTVQLMPTAGSNLPLTLTVRGFPR